MRLLEVISKSTPFFSQGSERTLRLKKNVALSLVLKCASVLISFLLVPITIDYLNPNEYGIWLTLSSILGWINFFDIGLGNGLRNRLGEALALNSKELGKKYVSTTFVLLSLLMLLFYIIFLGVNPFLDWNRILNVGSLQGASLGFMVAIVFAFFCLQFIFKIVSFVLLADQKPAMNDLITVAGSFLSLILIYLLTVFTSGSLFFVSVIFSAMPFTALLVAFFILFKGKYKELSPSFSAVDFKYSRDLIGLGLQFFIIQIAACVVIYSSTNIIISQLLGNENVTVYNIAYRYFNAATMVYMIILSPFWNASTEAFVKKDFRWIKSAVKKLMLVFSLATAGTILMILFSNTFYLLWIGDAVKIPLMLSIVVAVYTTLFNWQATFIYIINGTGKIKLQLYTTVVVAMLYVPMTVFMGNRWGVIGIVAASCISLLPTTILMPIQCVKIYSSKAKGIWFK